MNIFHVLYQLFLYSSTIEVTVGYGRFFEFTYTFQLLGAMFGELTDEGLNFNPLDNTFLYKSLTLACGGQENDVITWRFSENADLSSHEDLTATYISMKTGLSWLDVDNTKQGYYQCQINSPSYTVGIFDTSVVTGNDNVVMNPVVGYYLIKYLCISTSVLVAVQGSSYEYLEGVDRENILLLCDPMDSGSLSTLMWNNTYSNPLNIHSVRTSLPTKSTEFICSRGGLTTMSIFLSVTGTPEFLLLLFTSHLSIHISLQLVPTLDVKYDLFVAGSYRLEYPTTNDLTIPLNTTGICLTLSIVGKWRTPDGTNSTGSTFQISKFMSENVGIYTLYTNNWDSVEVGILIHIRSSPGITVI